MYAAQMGHESCVKELLKGGAAPNDVNAGGSSALLCAAEAGHLAVLDRLLQQGASSDVADSIEGLTPLIAAAKGGHTKCVAAILKHGKPKADAADRAGNSALLYAAAAGFEKIVAMLLEYGASCSVHDQVCVCEHCAAVHTKTQTHNFCHSPLPPPANTTRRGARPSFWQPRTATARSFGESSRHKLTLTLPMPMAPLPSWRPVHEAARRW